MVGEILRLVEDILAQCEEQIVIGSLHNAAAEKSVVGERAFLTKDDLQIIQPRRCIGAQSGTRKGGTGTADRGLGITEVDETAAT
jgi:hypothetical protein